MVGGNFSTLYLLPRQPRFRVRACAPSWRSALTSRLAATVGRSALVFEADLDLDAVLDDLAILDRGPGLHDLDRLDIPHGLRRGRDGLAGGIAPRARAGSDHLPDDDDAHLIASPLVLCSRVE